MKNKNFKFDGSSTQCRAILHMIGQSVAVFKSNPKTSEVAAWMQVSKTTARKYLNHWRAEGILIKRTEHWRGQAVVDVWKLEDYENSLYLQGKFKTDYELYCQRVLKVILT